MVFLCFFSLCVDSFLAVMMMSGPIGVSGFSKNGRFVYYVLVAAIVGSLLFFMASFLPMSKLILYKNIDCWFGADVFRVVVTETELVNDAHHRNSVHPFFSLITYPVNAVFMVLFGVDRLTSVLLYDSLVGGVLASIMLLVSQRVARFVSFGIYHFSVFALFIFSSSFIFLSVVPETFSLGALSIAVVIAFLSFGLPRTVYGWVGIGLVAFSVTITNYTVALIASFFRLKKYDFIFSMVSVLFVAVLVAFLQSQIFPKSGVFYRGLEKEAGYVQLTKRTPTEVARKVVTRAVNFISVGFVLPEVSVVPPSELGDVAKVGVVSILESSPPLLGLVALAGWWLLLFFGVINGIRLFNESIVLATCLAFYIGQFCLHLVYGDETFIYTLHSLPAVVVLIAGLYDGSESRVFRLLLVVTATLTAVVNVKTFVFVLGALGGV